jgi:4-methyl-5(b-hydroxyethyl)-thiazole monophosphate biosynthesis
LKFSVAGVFFCYNHLMMKKALVILAQGFEEIEAITPIDILRRGSVEVIVAGLDGINIASARHLAIHCSDILSNCFKDVFDVIVLPGGGKGVEHLSKSDMVNELLLSQQSAGRLIAAICASPAVVLAPLGILNNKKATCYPGMQEGFDKSTVYVDAPVVVDGNVITGRAAGSSIEFALAILDVLTDKRHVEKVRGDIVA